MSRDRDHEEFIAHYHDTKDKVFTYLMYRLHFDQAVCEDLLMDIVLRAYEKFHQFDSKKGSFKNWIFAIAHNLLVNCWRDKKESVSLDETEENGLTAATVTIEEHSSEQMDQRQIRHTLSLMKEPEREIITLRYLNDLSYAEIAGILGKEEGAVRTGLSRAMERFKIIYKKIYTE